MIYRDSKYKGFRRWRNSFKAAAFFAATLAGLIPSTVEANERLVEKYSSSQKQALSDHKVILAKADES